MESFDVSLLLDITRCWTNSEATGVMEDILSEKILFAVLGLIFLYLFDSYSCRNIDILI